MTFGDIEFIAGLLADEEVMRYWPHPFSRAEAEDWIHKQIARYQKDGHGYWLAVDKTSGLPVGQAGLVMSEVNGRSLPAIGYILAKEFWRQGFATEAAKTIRDWGLKRHSELIILIRPENEPSLRVARRLGAKSARRTLFAGFIHEVFEFSQGIE